MSVTLSIRDYTYRTIACIQAGLSIISSRSTSLVYKKPAQNDSHRLEEVTHQKALEVLRESSENPKKVFKINSWASIAGFALEGIKFVFARIVSTSASLVYSKTIWGLEKAKLELGAVTPQIAKEGFEKLNESQKSSVYEHVRLSADPLPEELDFSDTRLIKALVRLGFLKVDSTPLHFIPLLPRSFAEGGTGSRASWFFGQAKCNPLKGEIGYINGMGIPNFHHVTGDAANFSQNFVQGYNLHLVYNATHQQRKLEDSVGLVYDVMRMKAVDGGSYTKTSYLLVQQWIDFLDAHEDKAYLQIAHSEGCAQVNAALRLLKSFRPELLARIRVLAFCPAHFIFPEKFSPDLQAMNFIKKEDHVVLPWATGCHLIDHSKNIVVVPHRNEQVPHNHLGSDFIEASKGCISEFMKTGRITAE
jgi:hypothetical protein